MTRWRAIRTAPVASVIDVTIGMNSGTTPTASAMANISDSSGSRRSANWLDENEKQNEKHHRLRQQRTEVTESALDLGGWWRIAQAGGDLSECGLHSRRRYHADPHSAHDWDVPRKTASTSFGSAVVVAGRAAASCARDRLLLGGERLSGERGLLNVQVSTRGQPRVGWDHITGGQVNDVARHYFAPRDLRPVTIAPDRCRWDHALPKSLDGRGRARRLECVERGAEQEGDRDDRRVGDFADRRRKRARREQDQHQWTGQSAKQLAQRARAFRPRELVRSMLREARARLGRRETGHLHRREAGYPRGGRRRFHSPLMMASTAGVCHARCGPVDCRSVRALPSITGGLPDRPTGLDDAPFEHDDYSHCQAPPFRAVDAFGCKQPPDPT